MRVKTRKSRSRVMGVSTMDKERKRNDTQRMKFSKLEQDLFHLPEIHCIDIS